MHSLANKKMPYSYFKAVTGTRVAARRAGYNPESNPMTVAKIRANRIVTDKTDRNVRACFI